MTATRFQVFARQYASGASASSMSPRPRSRGLARDRRQTRLVDLRRRAARRRRARRRSRSPRAAARSSSTGRRSDGLLLDRSAEVHVEVARRRAVHARDLHVAAERDRADAVLDPVPPRLHERRREADVELARVHPDGARDEEVAGLVDEDQEAEPEDRDEDAHATGHAPLGEPARVPRRPRRARRGRAPGSPSAAASASSTISAIPRNGSRPSRNAATATSFAALKAHG